MSDCKHVDPPSRPCPCCGAGGPKQPRRVPIRGELCEVIGPKPADWGGLGATTRPPATLVRYPDGEVGAVPNHFIEDAP